MGYGRRGEGQREERRERKKEEEEEEEEEQQCTPLTGAPETAW